MDQAAKNVRTDIYGDWHRDPWDWPELEWVVSGEQVRLLVQRLNGTGVLRSAHLDMAKENFATRPAMIFDILDRLVYQALVDLSSLELIGDAPKWMYSWRLRRTEPKRGHYADMRAEWKYYLSHLVATTRVFKAGLTTDIVSFFSSITIEHLTEVIYQRVGSTEGADRLVDLLMGWDKMSGRWGLPQRANASSVLANMYLGPVDDVLRQYGAVDEFWTKLMVPQGAATRWVDDIWLFGDDEGKLRAAQIDLANAMRELGLEMNLAKTDVLTGEGLIAKARRLDHSAVDQALDEEVPSRIPLEELIDQILAKPEMANHTTVRFVTVRLRRLNMRAQAERFIDVADRMPHAASALARLFSDFELWRDLSQWFTSYASSPWGKIEWSVAQFATMFPSREPAPGEVLETLADRLESGCSVTLAAVAAQRLAAWDSPRARAVIRAAAFNANHPQSRRILGLAALEADEDRNWVRRLLNEFEENRATLGLLVDRQFVPVRAGADFAGF
jgi:hypothetical protein